MSKDKSFLRYVLDEILRDVSGITSRPMFGGYGIYQDGVIFAIITGGGLYFKVDSTNQADYEKEGSQPFQYAMKNGKTTKLSFWEIPQSIMENPALVAVWVQKSVDASRRAKVVKKKTVTKKPQDPKT